MHFVGLFLSSLLKMQGPKNKKSKTHLNLVVVGTNIVVLQNSVNLTIYNTEILIIRDLGESTQEWKFWFNIEKKLHK